MRKLTRGQPGPDLARAALPRAIVIVIDDGRPLAMAAPMAATPGRWRGDPALIGAAISRCPHAPLAIWLHGLQAARW
jgi:hypothetical protein